MWSVVNIEISVLERLLNSWSALFRFIQQKLFQHADPSEYGYILERLFSTLLCTDENISSCSMLIDKKTGLGVQGC